MIRLLGRKTSGNVQKVLFFLETTGVEYEREDYGRQFENTKTQDYLAMNPTAKVPTLVDGENVLWESNSILRYLSATYAPELTGSTPAECALVERWMDFLLAAINPGYLAGFKSAKLDAEERPANLPAQLKDLHANMAILDQHLANNASGSEFFALNKMTIADIALAPIIGRCLNFPYERPAMPALEAWFEKLSKSDPFKAATS